jgi:hypothetical protein
MSGTIAIGRHTRRRGVVVEAQNSEGARISVLLSPADALEVATWIAAEANRQKPRRRARVAKARRGKP